MDIRFQEKNTLVILIMDIEILANTKGQFFGDSSYFYSQQCFYSKTVLIIQGI